ncbi:MAG: hypothetical protein KatS3mg077_2824 [Candidatus Binatia bacterium]|nr:MAG: hypothetical protein KatS3mg077_2824 [Candidatus Binatia bacterium]
MSAEGPWAWCFAESEVCVVPVEAISAEGIAEEFAIELRRRAVLPEESFDLLRRAIRLYWQRSEELHALDPRRWFPPRAQHLCIVRRGACVRPYFQPIHNASWLLYEADFDPGSSSLEFATYLFFHAERMAWRREVLAAFEETSPYWLLRTEDEVADFCSGARRSARPDRAAFRALASALPWVRSLYYPPVRAPRIEVPGGFVSLGASGLLGSRSDALRWQQLRGQWQSVAEGVLARHYQRFAVRRGRRHGGLGSWLRERRPYVLVVGRGLEVLWDPDRPDDVRPLEQLLARVAPVVEESLKADIATVDDATQRFLRSVRVSLPSEVPRVEPGGLSFLWPGRPIVAYRLYEPGMARLGLPAPPYERLMLAARTMHEWGHLASAAGWVGVPPERRNDWEDRCALLEGLCEQVVRDAPAGVRVAVASELEALTRQDKLGRALARIVHTRMEDYRANLVARALLSRLELETYVRNNVTCLQQSMRAPAVFQRLVRYAYEFQYLLLLGLDDPWAYLCRSTWFDREYWTSGIVSRDLTKCLFDCVSELCALQAVQSTKMHFADDYRA